MATTTVPDAVVLPQDSGTGVNDADAVDAAGVALLSNYMGGSYVGEGLDFENHDATNDTVTVTAGYCYIEDDSSSTAGSRSAGGNPRVQSTDASGYDTEVIAEPPYVVILPTDVTVSVSDSTLNQVWVNINFVSESNSVEIRTDGGGGTTASPGETYVKIGEANPDNSSADTRANDGATLTADVESDLVNSSIMSSGYRPVVNAEYWGADPTGNEDSGPAIREAINQASFVPGGATVYLPNGEYFIGDVSGASAIPLHEDNVSLVGAGKHSTILRSHYNREENAYGDLTGSLISVYGSGTTDRVSNVTVSDLGIEIVDNWPDAALVAEYAEHCSVERVFVDNTTELLASGTSGIPIWWGHEENDNSHNKHLSVRDCEVVNGATNNPGIEMAGTDHGVITGCVINSRDGGEGGIKVEASTGVMVGDNEMEVDTNVDGGTGITFQASQECSATGNIIYDCVNGFRVAGDGTPFTTRNIHVVSNNVRAAERGVITDSVEELDIVANTIDCKTIGGNIGIQFRQDDGVSAKANTIKNAIYGIQNPATSIADGIDLKGNKIINCDTGILIRSPSGNGVSVVANTVINSTNEDIHLEQNNNGDPIENNIIATNECLGTGSGILLDAATDYTLAAVNLATVTNNSGNANVTADLNLGPL